MQPVTAAAGFQVDQGQTTDRCCRETSANARAASAFHVEIAIRAPGRKAGRDRRRGFQGLLIERLWQLSLLAEPLGTDRSEEPAGRRLQRHEPTQGSQAGLDIGRRAGRMPRHDQGLGQPRIVVGEPFLEPHPVLRSRPPTGWTSTCRRGAAGSAWPRDSVGHGGAIGVQPEQREGPRARRAKILPPPATPRRTGSGPSPARRTRIAACALAQRPECPPMAVLRAAIFEPASDRSS